MSKTIMITAGCLEIIAGVLILFLVKFPMMAVLLFVAGILFIIAGLFYKKIEENQSVGDQNS